MRMKTKGEDVNEKGAGPNASRLPKLNRGALGMKTKAMIG